MNRILLEPEEIQGNKTVFSDTRAEHIREVLSLSAGDSVKIGVLNGPTGTGTIDVLNENEVVLTCVLEQNIPPVPPVDLLLALPRPKVMKRLWAQLAALGVGHIFLANAEKVERYYFDSHVLDPAFYRARLIEGLQQAGDTRIPGVSVHKRLKVLLEDVLGDRSDASLRLAAHPGAGEGLLEIFERHALKTDARLLLAVGPEGGWTDYELELLGAHDFMPVSIGPRVLRSDTACVALLAIIHTFLSRP